MRKSVGEYRHWAQRLPPYDEMRPFLTRTGHDCPRSYCRIGDDFRRLRPSDKHELANACRAFFMTVRVSFAAGHHFRCERRDAEISNSRRMASTHSTKHFGSLSNALTRENRV